MPKGGTGANTAPILEDADVSIDHLGAFSYQAVAIDPDPKEKLSYSFLIDGKQRQTFTAADGVIFKIDKQTGEVGIASLIPYDPDALYTLTIAVEDRFKAIDLATVRLTFPPCTEYSIDNGRNIVAGPELINAGTDAFCFTTDVRTNTYAGIAQFTSNDRIVVSGVASVDDLSFTTGTGGGADDLYITYNSTATGTLDIIVLGDVITGGGLVFDYASAVAAIGFDFLSIDPCMPVSIDVGTLAGPPVVFDASDAAYCFTDDADVITDVVITGFGRNDGIDVSHATEAEYSFASSFDDVADILGDLQITYNALPTGGFTQIILKDVIERSDPLVLDYNTAALAVGFDFMTFA